MQDDNIERELEADRAFYDFYNAEQRDAARERVELSKWLLGSLILINGGALIAVANSERASTAGVPAFAAGVILALLCGFVSWINADARENFYYELTDTETIRHGKLPVPKDKQKSEMTIKVTYWISVVVGIFSLIGFTFGVFLSM